jgi:molybdate transport system substrate-binding protein
MIRWLPLVALAGMLSQTPRDQVLVSAAASLTNVLEQIAGRYESRSGDDIVLNFGASNTLARQIEAGARVDLFISADEPQLNAVAADIVPGTRVDLLANQLAIAVPDDRARRFTSARELMDPSIRRIAIGDPAAVPAGVYARAYLQQIGIWTALASRLVPSGSVRLALAAVESGAADAAIVYRTDIPDAGRTREAFVVPIDQGPRIVYPAAVIRSGRSPGAARRFLAFLRTPAAAALFRDAGFIPLQ